MSHKPTPIFALPPFDNLAGDIILRCRDGVHFRVRSDILLEASPSFSDMLAAIPCAGAESDRGRSEQCDGKPVIAVVEESDVIDPLLRLCYPTRDPVLKDRYLKDVRPVLAAAMKYQMEEATAVLKTALLSYIGTEPLRVWAYACLLRLEEEARTAARALTRQGQLPILPPKELWEVSAGDYYRLVKFMRHKGPETDSVKLFEADPTDIKAPRKKFRWGLSLTANEDPLGPFTFQSRPYADIICRSSDGQDFRAHKIVLCLASSMLRDKIYSLFPETSPLASPASGDLPVLHMDVDGKVLGGILESCYVQVEPFSFAYTHLSPNFVMSMMVAARTIGMKRVVEDLESDVYPEASRDEPLLGYLLAAKMRFSEAAQMLKSDLPCDIFSSGYLPEMETIPAQLYHTLFTRRRRRQEKLKAARAAKLSAKNA